MGIFSWFKKQEPEKRQIKFEELENWLGGKEHQDREKNLAKEIKNQLNELSFELKENLDELGQIDIDGKKVEPKIKLIVKENLNNYENYLGNLIIKINRLGQDNLHDLIKEINFLFYDFEKKSEQNFQKITYLIGEVGKVKENIGDFFKSIKKLLKENENLIETSRITGLIRSRLSEFNSIENEKKQIIKTISERKEKLEDLSSKTKKLSETIEKIKNSEEYSNEKRKKENTEKARQKLEKEIYFLKQLVDFKELANIYHSGKKEMNLIKQYRENFKDAFEKDRGVSLLELINLLQKTSMEKKSILKKIEQITCSENEVHNLEGSMELKASADILIKEAEIERLNAEIEYLKNQQSREKNKTEKIQNNLGEIKKMIKQELLRINMEML